MRTRLATFAAATVAASAALFTVTVPSAPAGPTDLGTVAVIGDSNTARAGTKVHAALTAHGYSAETMYVYGCGGKKMIAVDSCRKTTEQNVAEARAKLGTVDTWLIALGTNNLDDSDAAFAGGVRQVMGLVGATERVVWVDFTFSNPANTKAARVNPLLRATLGEFPNARYAGWSTFVHDPAVANPAHWLSGDVTHMSAVGYNVRSTYYAGQAARR